ncbi:Mannose-binding lectin [Pseudocohnilembus persalinus]|uniref:Mannose-binding lectin n=1 Tax=Pseudocohnilembus persalinus TaxID=266149 RepID=A0A0V0QJT4_PSEPJ|nr:Mannose-binding lectin [Pseudocohnilembus persalinus]|eukprot:KRX02557.1 Mannose-binding lectin [Pseudocohnilembus persalinus]
MQALQGQIPTRVQVGEWHKKQKAMNDSLMLTKEGGCHKINAIKVYFNHKYVLGLVIYYKLNDGDYLKAGHNVPKEKKILKKSNKIQSRVFEIGPDDYLLEVAGHYCPKEKVISRLTLTSYRGKIGNYGSDIGTPFCYNFKDYTFGPLTSGYRDYLEFLDFPVIPVPASFLRELNPVKVNINISDQTQRQQKVQYKKANDYSNGVSNGNGNFDVQNVPKPAFQGVYVKSQPASSYGSVVRPNLNISGQQPMSAQQFSSPQQQPFSYNQQQNNNNNYNNFQQPPVNNNNFYQPPVNNNNNNNNNNANNNGTFKSNYPTF